MADYSIYKIPLGYTGDWTIEQYGHIDATEAVADEVEAARGAALDLSTALSAKQPLDATLTALAGVTTAADKLIYATASDTFTTTTLTSAGRALIDDADAAAQRTTLGLGTMATQAASAVAITGGTLSGVSSLAVGMTPIASTTSSLFIQDDVTLKGSSSALMGNLYYASGWKFADAGHGSYIKFGTSSSYALEVGVSTNSGTATGDSATVEQVLSIDSSRRVGINTAPQTDVAFYVESILTSATAHNIRAAATVQTTTTSTYVGLDSVVGVASGTALTDLYHHRAYQGTFAGTVSTQAGFVVDPSLTGATNNYGLFVRNIGGASATTGKTMCGVRSYVLTASGGGVAYNIYADGTAANYFAGTIASLGSYNTTTASAANTYIDSTGLIQRSTSSIRYKTDIETLQQSYSDAVIFGARPVWYRSLCEGDNAGWGWYGLIAEELAEIDPRLVHWGYPTKTVTIPATDDEPETTRIEPDTDAPLQAEGVQYDRLTVLLIDVVQRQQQQISDMVARVAALEA